MLLSAGDAIAEQPSTRWHTSPECWPSPRYTHGPVDSELAARVRLVDAPASASSLMSGELSPNGGYRYLLQQTGTDWQLLVDVEQGRSLRLQLSAPAWAPSARWINEKLIYLRVHWGRQIGSDLILDVERGELIHHERIEEGSIAFEQFRQACGGQCPCPVAGAPGGFAATAPPSADASTGATTEPEPAEDGLRLTGLVRPGAVRLETLALYAAPQLSAKRIAATGLQLRQREASYESPALAVYGQRPGWYRLRLQTGIYVWAAARELGEFMPLRQLLPDRLNHLTRSWDGRLWESPDARPAQIREGGEVAVQYLASRRVDGRLWVEVALYKDDPCSGGDGSTAERGWVPAHDDQGEPLVWFWSRGC